MEFRALRTAEELAALPRFERLVWDGEEDLVPVSMLVSVVREGGLALAAYDGDELVATSFAFPTHEREVLHSHYIAVHPDRRGAGLGEAIKRRQADWCREHGYEAMRWTFDPLQLANAHLNLNKLGAFGVEYHTDLYGALGGINGTLPSDRLTVQWWFDRPRPSFAESLVVPVPPATPQQIAASSTEAFTARLAVRDALAPHLADGWVVAGVDREARTYTLSR
ncbi:MAG: GNAT family N-acetyltransferase [Ilumatobacteraceae bacterium]